MSENMMAAKVVTASDIEKLSTRPATTGVLIEVGTIQI